MIVCLVPKLSLELVISNVLNCQLLEFFVVSLTWVVLLGWREKRILIPENDLYFIVTNSKLR